MIKLRFFYFDIFAVEKLKIYEIDNLSNGLSAKNFHPFEGYSFESS